jgi:Ca-activated chloride channel family protein
MVLEEPRSARPAPMPIVPGPEPLPPRDVPPRIDPPRPPSTIRLAPAEVASVKVDTRITDQIAVVRIEEEFYNPNDRVCEGTFLFPVPKGAQLDRFTLAINGKPMEAELLGADKAREIYQDIVRRSLDPALLEYVGRDLFKVRVFPIEPHSKRQITVTYTQLLTEDSGMLNWVLPLRQDTAQGKTIPFLSVKVNLESKQALKTLYSPSHKVEIARQGDHRATVGFEASAATSEADFQLLFSRARGELGIDVIMHRTGTEDGYFLLLATPQLESEGRNQVPKDVVFVLDSSGSMAGAKLEQAKKALRFCIANLNDQDRFEILRFSTEVEGVFQKLTDTGGEARDRALSFVDRIKPTGGTAIHDALTQALALKPKDTQRPYVVVFLTDGRPTVGPSDENQIAEVVTGKGNLAPENLTRVFCFGIGTDVNTHLLDRVSEATKASTTYVLPEEDLELKVSAFFSRIKEPALSNLRVEFPNGVKVSKLYPQSLPDLFKGQQLLVAGRYSGRGTGLVRISGVLNGDKREYSRELTFVESVSENAFLPRLWATRRIGYLLDEIRLRGENVELKDEVVELARKYAVVTPYTAYLVTEDEARRGISANRQTFQRGTDAFAQQQLRRNYRALMEDRSGDQAVASARSFSLLKSAEAPSAAIQSGALETLRGATPMAAPATLPVPGQPTRAKLEVGQSGAASRTPAAQQVARFVGGQSFFFNGEQWMDARIQNMKDSSARKVEFASAEYFELLTRHPEAKDWFALGQSVQVVIDGQVIDVRPAGR